jgi:hypothetical protein
MVRITLNLFRYTSLSSRHWTIQYEYDSVVVVLAVTVPRLRTSTVHLPVL